MDVLDKAEEVIEIVLDKQLSYRKPQLKPMGACWFCNEPIGAGALFCHNKKGDDLGCAGDYERREDTRRKQGL
jgi:hypothetical protein